MRLDIWATFITSLSPRNIQFSQIGDRQSWLWQVKLTYLSIHPRLEENLRWKHLSSVLDYLDAKLKVSQTWSSEKVNSIHCKPSSNLNNWRIVHREVLSLE